MCLQTGYQARGLQYWESARLGFSEALKLMLVFIFNTFEKRERRAYIRYTDPS